MKKSVDETPRETVAPGGRRIAPPPSKRKPCPFLRTAIFEEYTLTGEEVKANKIKLAPEKIAAWWHMLRAFLIARVPELKVLFSQMTRPPGTGISQNQR